QSPHTTAYRSNRLHDAGELLQPAVSVRENDCRAPGASCKGTEQPRGVSNPRRVLLGQGVPRCSFEGEREERLRAERHWRRRQGIADQAGLHRRADLQEPPPAASSELGEGPPQAASPPQGSQRAAGQGRGSAQEESVRRRELAGRQDTSSTNWIKQPPDRPAVVFFPGCYITHSKIWLRQSPRIPLI